MRDLRQGTACTVVFGPAVASSDGYTKQTALTIAQADVRLSKNGGLAAQSSEATSAAHNEFARYRKNLDATDVDTPGHLQLNVDLVGTMPMQVEFNVLTQAAWDAKYAGTPVEANVVQISGDTGAADNAESFFDGTGYAGTNNVIPTVTTVNGLAANVITAAATAADFGTELGTAVWSSATRLLTAGTNIVLDKGTGVTGFNDLDPAGVRGAVGLAAANLDTQIGTLATAAALAVVDGVADDIKAKTDALPTDPADQSLIINATDAIMGRLGAPAGVSIAEDIGTRLAASGYTAPPSAGSVADAVWDEALAGHATAGTAGAALTAAASGGGGGGGATAEEIADAVLSRDFADVPSPASRSLLNAARFLRNRWSISGTTLTVRQEDDSTTAWSATVSTNASADPVTGVDPG